MSTSWKVISPAEAATHPLYGVKNWLALFAFGILLVPLRELAELNRTAHDMGVTISQLLALDKAFSAYATFSLAFEFAMMVGVYWLLFTKHRRFRLVATSLLLASWPIFLAIALVTEATEAAGALGIGIFPWAISCAIWVTYLNRSRRVRVTFEHAIRVDLSAPQFGAFRTEPINASNDSRQTQSVPSMSSSNSLMSPAQPSSVEPARARLASDDEQLWAIAIAEFDSDGRRSGLWAKSFAKSNGNEGQAKAAYLQERVQQLAQEAATQAAAEASSRAQATQAARELVTRLKQTFIAGTHLGPKDISCLAHASNADPSLAGLSERLKGETLLHVCARYGLQEEASILLRNGANANAGNGSGQKPFSLAEPGTLRAALFDAAARSAET